MAGERASGGRVREKLPNPSTLHNPSTFRPRPPHRLFTACPRPSLHRYDVMEALWHTGRYTPRGATAGQPPSLPPSPPSSLSPAEARADRTLGALARFGEITSCEPLVVHGERRAVVRFTKHEMALAAAHTAARHATSNHHSPLPFSPPRHSSPQAAFLMRHLPNTAGSVGRAVREDRRAVRSREPNSQP